MQRNINVSRAQSCVDINVVLLMIYFEFKQNNINSGRYFQCVNSWNYFCYNM